MVHHGAAATIRENRQLVLNAAYRDHPERFVRRPPSPPQLPKEVWIGDGESHYLIEGSLDKEVLSGTYDCFGLKGTFTFTRLAAREG
jgi:hypothetical protein